jgi:hypothetical protein
MCTMIIQRKYINSLKRSMLIYYYEEKKMKYLVEIIKVDDGEKNTRKEVELCWLFRSKISKYLVRV